MKNNILSDRELLNLIGEFKLVEAERLTCLEYTDDNTFCPEFK